MSALYAAIKAIEAIEAVQGAMRLRRLVDLESLLPADHPVRSAIMIAIAMKGLGRDARCGSYV